MRTLRPLSLTVAALFIGFAASAQIPASGPTPITILSWVAWWAVGVVLLMAVITCAAAASAAQRRYAAQPAAPTADTAGPAPAPAAAAPEFARPREAAYAASSFA
jgi:hypothetical protein